MNERHSVIIRTLCFVFNPQGELLLLERAAGKFDAGMYNGLGGHVEREEDIVQSANREINEESGLVAKQTKIVGIMHVSDFFGKDVILFITSSQVETSATRDSKEGKLMWINPKEINNYKVYADINLYLERIEKGSEQFHGTIQFDGKGEILKIDFYD